MWIKGFERNFGKVIDMFEVLTKKTNNLEMTISRGQTEGVAIHFRDSEGISYYEEVGMEELYAFLVPKNDLRFYYLIDDVIMSKEDESSGFIVEGFLKNLTNVLFQELKRKIPTMSVSKPEVDVDEEIEFGIEIITSSFGAYEQLVFI